MNKFRFEPTLTKLKKMHKWSNIKQTLEHWNYKIPPDEVGIWKENGWILSEDEKSMTKGNQVVMIKKGMKTLEEHNLEVIYVNSIDHNQPILNNISCPKCGSELYDSNPMATLTSNPAQKEIHCSNCDYKGYRLT